MDNRAIVFIVLIVGYSIVRSFLLKRKEKGSWLDYSRGGQGYISVLEGVVSIYTALVGGFIVFGLVQIGFQGGLTGYFLGAAYILGIPLLLLSLSKAKEMGILGQGLLTIDQLLNDKFGPWTERMFLTLSCALFIGVLAGQFIAAYALVETISGDHGGSIVAMASLFTILYTLLFGLRGVLLNDKVQSIFEFSLSIVIPAVVAYHLFGKESTLSLRSQTIGGDYGAAYPIIACLFLTLSFLVRADLWQRLSLVEPAKQTYVIVWVVAGLLLYYIGMTTVGIALRENAEVFNFINGVPPENLVPAIINNLIQHWFWQSVCISGLIIALLSSIDSYLNLIGLLSTKVALYGVYQDTTMSQDEKDRVLLINSKVATFGAAIIAVTTALVIPDLVEIMSASFSLLAVMVPLVVFALWRGENVADYVGSVSLAVSLAALVSSLPFLEKTAFIPATIVGVFTFFLLYNIEKRRQRAVQKQAAKGLINGRDA